MNYTTIEQSKKLLELGLNPDTADMVIVKDNTYCNALSAFNGVTLCQNYSESKDKTNYIPCWSLGALIQMLPLDIQTGASFPDKYNLEFKLYSGYIVAYCIDQSHHPIIFTEKHETLIEACIEMVLWLIENGYIKTEKK